MKSVKIEPIESTECPSCSVIEVSCDECQLLFDAGEQVFCSDDEDVLHYHKRCLPADEEEEPEPFKQLRNTPPAVPLIGSRSDQWRMN
jgi:hypothetical protein